LNQLSVVRPECLALLCNPSAGKGKALKLVDWIKRKLDERSRPFMLFTHEWPEDFNNFSSVWIVGGDGTLNYFINRYPHIDIPIALFKGGSGNDFAWKLYGDKSVEDYLELAILARHRKIDAGICNGRYFINGIGIGFDGAVVKAMGTKKFLPAAHLAYLLVVLGKLCSYREKEMIIQAKRSVRTEKIFLLSIANGSRYGGGFLVAPQAKINDGELDLVIIKKIAVWLRILNLHRMSMGRHLNLPFVSFSKESAIMVESKEILQAHLDGEMMQASRFDIVVQPGLFSFIY
jgi:diacylglycerol kinase (ATP)